MGISASLRNNVEKRVQGHQANRASGVERRVSRVEVLRVGHRCSNLLSPRDCRMSATNKRLPRTLRTRWGSSGQSRLARFRKRFPQLFSTAFWMRRDAGSLLQALRDSQHRRRREQKRVACGEHLGMWLTALRAEPLEVRKSMAADVYVNDNWDFIDSNLSTTLDAGDLVFTRQRRKSIRTTPSDTKWKSTEKSRSARSQAPWERSIQTSFVHALAGEYVGQSVDLSIYSSHRELSEGNATVDSLRGRSATTAKCRVLADDGRRQQFTIQWRLCRWFHRGN